MPNYCEIDLMIEGPTERIKEFAEKAAGENGAMDFNKFIPYPEEWAKLDAEVGALRQEGAKKDPQEWPQKKDGYNSGGYEWCCENWGVKWNAGSISIDKAPEFDYWMMHFDTPWAPPCPVFAVMAELFPDLAFQMSWFESGMEKSGRICASGGKINSKTTVEYFGTRGG